MSEFANYWANLVVKKPVLGAAEFSGKPVEIGVEAFKAQLENAYLVGRRDALNAVNSDPVK